MPRQLRRGDRKLRAGTVEGTERQSSKDRIGVELGNRMRVEDSPDWAGENGCFYVNTGLDNPQNALASMDAERIRGIRRQLDRHGIRLGLHTLSGVNTA